MSKYGSYSCYHCLCEVCNRIRCKHLYKRYKVGFCTGMMIRELCPVVKCDFFIHKEKNRIMRVKRKRKRADIIINRLEAIEKGLETLSGKL